MADIFITSEFFGRFSDEGINILKDAGHNLIDPYGHKFLQPEDIIKYSDAAEAFICDLEQITSEVVDASPNLKIISRRGVGVDSVCIDYCSQMGIEVARTLGVVELPVAELVMAYILEFSRNVSKLNQNMQLGIWDRMECHSVDGKTIGLVGMGKIACEVAKRAKAFNMKVIYSDLLENKKAETDFEAKRVKFDELLKKADFISVHTPLTDETKGLFSYSVITQMKETAYLINTARGAIVDENGLYMAVSEGRISGAAIDVFDVEPKTDSILRKSDKIILTPHAGTFTQEIFIKMDILAAKNVVDFFNRR